MSPAAGSLGAGEDHPSAAQSFGWRVEFVNKVLNIVRQQPKYTLASNEAISVL
jgi:hypothetical protein